MKERICAMAETWILYQTTNLANGKIYVGVHKVADNYRSKNYLGSGQAMKIAIKKYGRENFTRVTLAEFTCAKDAYTAEEIMVTEDFVKNSDNYNMKSGGKGGQSIPHTEETKKKIGLKSRGRTHNIGRVKSVEERAKISAGNTGKSLSKETREKISKSLVGNKYRLGIPHSEETKAKMSASRKGNTYALGRVHTEETKKKIAANIPNNVAVVIDGKYYQSKSAASRAEKVPHTTLCLRINSNNPDFAGYRLATEEEKSIYASSALE